MFVCNYNSVLITCTGRDFYKFFDGKYGNCFTFNSGLNGSYAKSLVAGPMYGKTTFTQSTSFTSASKVLNSIQICRIYILKYKQLNIFIFIKFKIHKNHFHPKSFRFES